MATDITIIGIAGGTGSGKSTVVRKIVEALPPHHVAVVPLDSYYNDTTGMTEEERHAINFDHPDAFDWKLLIKQVNDLRNGLTIEQPIERNYHRRTKACDYHRGHYDLVKQETS